MASAAVGPVSGRRRRRRAAQFGLGLSLLLVAAAGTAYPLWWQHRQDTVGSAEVRALEHADARAAAGAGPCTTAPGPGVLRIASTHVVAPVLAGVTDNVLNTSVGHVTTTPWPGQPGLAILEAHDVGYFAANGALRSGDQVTYTTGCDEYTFAVTGKTVEKPGQAIDAPSGAGIALISCWPTNALWFTSHRLVVLASLVARRTVRGAAAGTVPAGRPSAAQPIATLPPAVPGGQPSVFSYVHAGTLKLTGSPSAAFRSSPQPLAWLGAALGALAAYRQGAETHALWLLLLVKHSPPAAWDTMPLGSIYAAEQVSGDRVEAVTLLAKFGAHTVDSMTIQPIGGHLYVTGGGVWPAPAVPPPS